MQYKLSCSNGAVLQMKYPQESDRMICVAKFASSFKGLKSVGQTVVAVLEILINRNCCRTKGAHQS